VKVLKNILYKVSIESVIGSMDISVATLQYDSRSIEQNDVFVAIKGGVFDGHAFISQAIDQGAVVVVCKDLPPKTVDTVTYVKVDNTSRALALMASNYYQNPSKNLKLVGITGTNGKTTVATLLYKLFTKAGYKVGLISTVKIMVGTHSFSTTHTTPDSLVINAYLSQMNSEGVEFCFMEVSSHGIHQFRTEGLTFEGAVFTNLSHDHLDYHASFAEYRDVKKSFFVSNLTTQQVYIFLGSLIYLITFLLIHILVQGFDFSWLILISPFSSAIIWPVIRFILSKLKH
jgi:UDP-N-acetylmuramoyl-L-alanyl-D-glutamate--2,6-diaminopimelate ligase